MLDEFCNFKIDTGSDISIVNSKFVNASKTTFPDKNSRLIYLTGKIVPIQYQINMKVQLEKFSIDLSMFNADMKEDCLLDNGFLSFLDLESYL